MQIAHDGTISWFKEKVTITEDGTFITSKSTWEQFYLFNESFSIIEK